MPTASTASFATWTIPFWPTLGLVLTAWVYLLGFRAIRRTRPALFPTWRAFCFLGGLLALFLAIASPLDSLSNLLLAVHMTQHLLLMSVAPPLVALGAPQVPLLRGLPKMWVREGLGPFFTLAPVHALQRLLKSRLVAWLLMNLAFLAWHVPRAYDLALAHPQLHEVEHGCFFFTSLLFWWPIVEPWPTVYKGSRWLLLPYLMSADIVNTALSAFLSFSGRVVYPSYANAPRLFGISALNDQVAAGSLMWVAGSSFFLFPIMWITVRQLSHRKDRSTPSRTQAHSQAGPALQMATLLPPLTRNRTNDARLPLRPARPAAGPPSSSRGELFSMRPVGAFFRSRYGRQTLQAILLLVAAAVVVDGFLGHPMSSMNLAGIVPWTYARALFVLGLLTVGNLFCMSCPFTLPREVAKKLAAALGFARLPWPRALRNKWLSAALLGLFFWAYEAFALWDSPARTAWLLLAYFVTVIVIDSIFRGASFCKYVCPVGQFNFVASLLSPLELQARSLATCSSCETRNCIAGTEDAAGQLTQRGCELDLFMPLKSGNLDCTLCMDCVKACPHDNIGLFVQPPARELVQLALVDPQRSSIGHLSRRPDVAALALVVLSAGFASAAVMVVPLADALSRMSHRLPAWLAPTAGLALAALVPALVCALLALGAPAARNLRSAAVFSPRNAEDTRSARLCRGALALLPLGLGMWAAHLSFHLITGWNSLVPALLQAARDLPFASSALPGPDWAVEHSLLAPNALLRLQLLLLDGGLLFALYLGWRLVRPARAGGPGGARSSVESSVHSGLPSSLRSSLPSGHQSGLPWSVRSSVLALAPWAAINALLYAAGVWVLLQPMQMRGMMGM